MRPLLLEMTAARQSARSPRWWLVLLLAVGCAHGAGGRPELLLATPLEGEDWTQAAPQRLREATVGLLQEGRMSCTGAVAERSDVVVTALHCLGEPPALGERVWVKLSDGALGEASLVAFDGLVDTAVLVLDEPAAVVPLPLADSDRFVGREKLFFLGRPLKRRQVQQGWVSKRAACPDLPEVNDAVFGAFDAYPGDSGAPLVSEGGIIAFVHGGARCNIAIPSQRVRPLLSRVLQQLAGKP